jgi:D-glycero-alpha-D-manno-heptose-7-phosphate kinase
LLKKEMSGWISNPQIDERYDKAMQAWALWGKILGAGWWWFFLFYVPKDRQEDVYTALSDLKKVKFNFDNTGSKIIFIH